MARERILNNRSRRAEKVRGEVIRQSESSATTTMLQQDNLPRHLQPLKENYEVSLVADEVQKQKRTRANLTIAVMAESAVDVTLDVNEKTVQADEVLAARPMRPERRDKVTKAIDELANIAYAAIQDGFEEGTIRVNEIADSDPTTHKPANTAIEIDDLTPRERLSGKVRRKQ